MDFPELISIYKSQNEILISIPFVNECDYHKNTEVSYWYMAGESLELISEKEFLEYSSNGMSLVSDLDDRQNIMKEFCEFVDNWDWRLEHEDVERRLILFKNVFYSEHE